MLKKSHSFSDIFKSAGKKRSNSLTPKSKPLNIPENQAKRASEAPVTVEEKGSISLENLEKLLSRLKESTTKFISSQKPRVIALQKKVNEASMVCRFPVNMSDSYASFVGDINYIFLNHLSGNVNTCDEIVKEIKTLSEKIKVGKDLKDYRKKKGEAFILLDKSLKKLEEWKEMIDKFENEKVPERLKKINEFKRLIKYKKNFEIWYTKKATDDELEKYKGFLGNILLRKSNPKKLIGKVNACKTMNEFEELIKTWGMDRNMLKNKKIFGNVVK